MYQIYWHNKLLRQFDDFEKAENCFEWFNKFLLKDSLIFTKRDNK